MGVGEGHGGGEREQRQHHCGIGTPTVTLSYICMYVCTCVQMTTTASVLNGVHTYVGGGEGGHTYSMVYISTHTSTVDQCRSRQ